MHLPQASWLFAACMGAAIVNAVSVVELDLVFPRNETYSPTQMFPLVFAVRNTQKAELLNPYLTYRFRNLDNTSDDPLRPLGSYVHLERENLSASDPYITHRFFSGLKPGRWLLLWHVLYDVCDVDAEWFSEQRRQENFDGSREFTITNSTGPPNRQVDLVAATANNSCPGVPNGAVIYVTDATMETVPSRINDRRTCVVTTNATEADIPVHTPNPCAVSISSEVAASIYANFTAETCENWPTPPAYVGCPADGESAAQRLIVLAVSGLLVIFGALAFTGVHSW